MILNHTMSSGGGRQRDRHRRGLGLGTDQEEMRWTKRSRLEQKEAAWWQTHG